VISVWLAEELPLTLGEPLVDPGEPEPPVGITVLAEIKKNHYYFSLGVC
jgi:hypothetical protein